MLSAFKIVDICQKYEITSEEFFLIHLLYRKDYLSFSKYLTKCKKSFYSNNELLALAEKGILKAEPIEDAVRLNCKLEMLDLFLTEEFRNQYYKDTEEAGKELWEAYPNTAFIGGQDVILKKGEKIGAVYFDKDTLIKLYCEKIQNNLEVHKEIIAKIKANKDIINFTIRAFIFDELWDSLKVDAKSSDNYFNNKTII